MNLKLVIDASMIQDFSIFLAAVQSLARLTRVVGNDGSMASSRRLDG
jgi:hypothetical protein